MLTGDNGILTQAQRAKNETANAQANEESVLENYEQYIEGTTNGGTLTTVTGNETTNTKVQDSLGNVVTVPAGFRVVNPGDNVEDGIVIEDVSHGATAGSQFVWIPVGDVKKKDGSTINITLGRYVFNTDGTINEELSKTEPTDELKDLNSQNIYYTEGLKGDSTPNTHAKDINMFISKVNGTGGYYVARYEARTTKRRTVGTENSDLTQITVKPNDYIYNYVTQPQAASLSKGMYTEGNFTSDLINSYAWDTTLIFIQECSKDNRYSIKGSYNTENIAIQGTNNLEKSQQDVICNIYDMASNCLEWETETVMNNPIAHTCVARGGNYWNVDYASYRATGNNDFLSEGDSFRLIIYL